MDFLSFPVSARWANALLLPAAIVATAPTLSAQSDEDATYMGENPDRYASIRVLEGDATIRKGDVEEPLSRGIPVAEGDVVESHGRGVLQLADGTRVAFGSNTRFQVVALFSDQEQERQVLLRLDHGRLRVAMGRESEARIRVDLPSGSAFLSDGADAGFEMERDRTARVKVHSGRLVFSNERDKASLLAGERLTVYSDQDRLDRVQDFNTYGGDAFDGWSERSLAVRPGPSWDKVPPEIRYYSGDLDEHGEWIYVDELRTWCWRPLRVSADWRPYWQGRWSAYPGGMTWISDEPWGYVTYHHGRWGWGAGFGWYWIPGVYYSPAWVAWQTHDAYFGWAPIGYYNRPVSWGYGPWGGGYCWNVVEINIIHVHHIHTRTRHDSGVIRTFNSGSGSTGFTSGPSGNRSLSHPWRQSPLVVNQDEFRNPARFRQATQDREGMRMRQRSYEQQAGRTIYRRPLSAPAAASPASGSGSFEDRAPLRGRERPVLRNSGPSAGSPGPNRSLVRPVPPPTLDRSPIPQERSNQPRSGSGPGRIESRPRESGPAVVIPPPAPGRVVPRERPIQPRATSHSGSGSSADPLPSNRTNSGSGSGRSAPRGNPSQGPGSGGGQPQLPPPIIRKRSLGRP